jgi:DNA repair protein RecO (recombination protein O)
MAALAALVGGLVGADGAPRLDATMGPIKTEAVVLRSMRYGEADRILHLYTPERGRVSAIAKGSRRPHSRFGGRLEPFFRLRVDLHEGRSELLTVTGAQTIEGYVRLRTDARSLDAAARACDAVARLFETAEGHPGVFNLLCNALVLLDREPSRASRARALAFRLKLLVAAGLTPRLAACVSCDAGAGLTRFTGAGGGMLCDRCWSGAAPAECGQAVAFPLGEDAMGFMAASLSHTLAEAPEAAAGALRQVERAIAETVEHHAHVRLMAAGGGRT